MTSLPIYSSDESIGPTTWDPRDDSSGEEASTVLPSLTRSQSQPVSNINQFTKNYIIPAAKWAYSPIKHKHKTKEEYHIEYSVFKPLKNVPTIGIEELTDTDTDQISNIGFTEETFNKLVQRVVHIIEEEHIYPERISQGSSGSYFVFDTKVIEPNGDVKTYKVGVFKPKDEEPYGPLSPKWTKWMHRTFFPCFFGRSCLIPNLGYISEAAASVLDRQLKSFLVPLTKVIHLRSPSFYYSYWSKNEDVHRLPNKIGSFQIFLDGYTEAQTWFRQYPIPSDVETLPDNLLVDEEIFRWSKESLVQFREELEKLVILDYIMRNTDRGLDNWMIRVDWITSEGKKRPIIKIGAIDSGLAFPWKRPDAWRSFPYGWLFLPMSIIGQPFSVKTRRHYLRLLTSKIWWEQTVVRLRQVFELDQDFKERMWHKQLAVLKGQAFNVMEVLKSGRGPLELTRRENMLVWDEKMSVPRTVDAHEHMATGVYGIEQSNVQDSAQPGLNINSAPPIDIFAHGSPQESSTGSEHLTEQTPLIPKNKEPTFPPNSPFLLSKSPRMVPVRRRSYASLNEELTGYEYNEEVDTSESKRHIENKNVIIERLEKVTSRPPFFTWC